jgi:hypothetical protein
MTNYYAIVVLESHTAVTLKSIIFWNVTPCSLVEAYELLSEDTTINNRVLQHSCVEAMLICHQVPFRSKMLIALSLYRV